MEFILKYFTDLTEIQKRQFEALSDLYHYWNERINLISRKDIDMVNLHHVLHSLTIAKFYRFEPGTRVIDIGTGGGFPGIPLAIFYPQVNFHLVDSVGKKIKVVLEITEALKLDNVSTQKERAENLTQPKFNYAISRAVTTFPEFVELSKKSVSVISKGLPENGFFYYKGGDFSAETAMYKKHLAIHDISSHFDEPYFEQKKIIYLPQQFA